MSWVDWKTVAEGGKKFVEKLKCNQQYQREKEL